MTGGGGRAAVRAALVVVLVGAALTAGWYAAGRFESPAQRAAAASAPTAMPVTATVSRGDLADEITATAQIGYAGERQVSLPSGGGSMHVVTAQPIAPGSAVGAGDALLVVDGRPVIVLPGAFPFYRDLHPGDNGPDVAQLQDGLRAAGAIISAREDGTFGRATAAAIARRYKTLGYATASEQVETTNPDDGTTTTTSQLLVPVGELLALPQLPALVTAVPPVGTVLDGSDSTATFAEPTLQATADIAPSVLASVTDGTQGTLTDDSGGSIDVQVSAITAGDATTGASGSVVLAPSDGSISSEWAGKQVLATLRLQVAATDSLIVPTRAVAVDATGTAHVLRQSRDGSFASIAVEIRGQLAGQTAVAPFDEGTLAEGDPVKVG